MAGVPNQIPGVELLDELGHGTYSVVYRARRGDDLYAVKVPLRNETGIKLKLLGRRFRREAVALARLRHPLLPRVMEVGVVDRAPYIIMELATGETLAQQILAGPLGEEEVVDLGRQLAGVLRQVHESGLVHRDVKPRNIVFDSSTGQVRLVDFGFAASIDAAFRILEPVGTLEYAAPEQVSDLRQRVDGRADLYALGCVLYECLTGSPPFPDLDPRRFLYQHGAHQVPDVREAAPHVSQALATILKRLLARNPDDRYANAAALEYDLEHIEQMRSGALVRSAYGDNRAPTVLLPMLGRDKELIRLRREWADAEGGHSRIVLLRGPTGCGKTRLAQALMEHVVGRGHQILGAKCHAWDPRPFSAIREIVEGNARELSASDQAKVAERISMLAGDLAPLVKVLSPTIAGMLANVAPVPQSQDAQHIFVEGLAEFLGKLFREEGPAIVFVDDLQWLDPSSRRVLRRAIDRAAGSKVLYLFAARGAPGEFAEMDRFFQGLDFTVVDLEKLDEGDVISLIRAYLGDPVIDAEIVRSVTQLSDGTPLSTLEILRMMLDDGQLLPSWGRWKFDIKAASQMHLPRSTLGILARRIETLDDMTKATLTAAAIVGMIFSDRLLPSICGLEEGHTTAALAEARRAMLVEADPHGRHRFVHDSVREVLLNTVTEEARHEFHQRAAEAMDQLSAAQNGAELSHSGTPSMRPGSSGDAGGGRPSSVFVRGDPDADACYALADHYARGVAGRTPLRVYETNVAAGRLAFDSFDNGRALVCFRSAEEAATVLHLAIDPGLSLLVGEAKLRIGALEKSREQFTGVLSASTDPLHQALALSRIAWIYQLQLDSARAWDALGKAFAKLGKRSPSDSLWAAVTSWILWVWSRVARRPPIGDERERQRLEAVCSLYYQAARLASLDEKPLRIVQSALSGVVPAERLGPSTSLARTYVTLSFVLTALGRRKAGRKYLERAEAVARSTADPVAIAQAMQIHSAVAAWEGNVRDALETGRRCLEEYGHWRELSEYCLIAYNQQALLEMCGRSVDAWYWMDRVIDKVEHHDGDPFLLEVLELGARAALTSIGREREAESRLRKLRELTIRIPDNSGFHTWTYVPRIRLYTECGDLGAGFEALVAELEAKKLNPRRVHLGVTQFYIHVAHARVHAVLRASDDERSSRIDKLAHALRDLKAAVRIPIIRAHANVIEGYYAMFVRESGRADRLFAVAEAFGRKESAPWILYAVYRGRAHLLRAEGRSDAARDQAKLAEALATEHGMAYRLRWIQEEFGVRREQERETGRGRFSEARSRSEVWRVRSESSSGQLRTLLRLTQEAPEDLDPARQGRAIVDDLVYSLRADRGLLFTLGETPGHRDSTNSLRLLVGRSGEKDIGESDEASRMLVESALIDWSSSGGNASYLLSATLRSAIVAAPLAVDATLVGAVYVDRELARGAFSEADGELLVALAGQIPLALELARALSSRQRAEEELQRAQKFEAMGRLAQGVARDFGRALAEIRTSTDALTSSNMNGSADKIQAIRDAASRAEELTRQLVAFSGGEPKRREPFSVNDRIRRAKPLLQELLGPSITLATRPDVNLDLVNADAGQIDYILVTLAVRARDVMPDGGTVVIETSNAKVEGRDIKTHPTAKAGEYVRIGISDTGRAIDPGFQKQMFEPFASNDEGSSSLALATLYRSVVQSGGFVDIESIVGEGTTFRIYWPKTNDKTEAKLAVFEAPKLPGGTETILLVEHEPLISDALDRVLKGLGYRVLRANDGVQALKLVARRYLDIDMVISDVLLPGMNGLELGRELVKMRKTLRLLYLSDPGEGLDGNGIAAEKVELLQKPVQQDVLAQRVREVLDRRLTS